ncbi:hypothetical protein ACFE04_031451 [Oxalis oulophora]
MENRKSSNSSEAVNMVQNDARKKLSALIVDDDRIIRMISKATLKKVCIEEIEAVENGQKAIDCHLEGKTFDIIVMDLDMPIKNGVQATTELRAMGVKNAIVGVTAATSEKDKQDFIEAGIDCLFAKPLTVEMVQAVVSKLGDI